MFDVQRASLRTFADPSYGDEISIDHLAATANAVLVRGAGTGGAVTGGDFGGWGGDLSTFYADWRNNHTAFASGYAFCAARLAVRGTTSSWGFSDMVEDVDGHLLGLACRAGAAFPTAFRSHLVGTGHTTRFSEFFARRFGSSTVTAKANANTMLVSAGEDAILNTLRDLAIKQSGGLTVPLPGTIPATELDSFVTGFADRLQALAALA